MGRHFPTEGFSSIWKVYKIEPNWRWKGAGVVRGAGQERTIQQTQANLKGTGGRGGWRQHLSEPRSPVGKGPCGSRKLEAVILSRLTELGPGTGTRNTLPVAPSKHTCASMCIPT